MDIHSLLELEKIFITLTKSSVLQVAHVMWTAFSEEGW